jgi:hypothetical protein
MFGARQSQKKRETRKGFDEAYEYDMASLVFCRFEKLNGHHFLLCFLIGAIILTG